MRKFLCFLIVMWVSDIACAYVYTDYTWHEYNGNEYAFTLDVGSWEEAELEAAAIGGHLVTINDEDENNWILSTLQEHDDEAIWIGLYQDLTDPQYTEPAGGWKCVNGVTATYMNWHPSQPDNNWERGEHYGVMFPQSTAARRWADWF